MRSIRPLRLRISPTVPIYYEGRLAKLNLDEAGRPKIDPTFEELTEGEEVERREKLKSKWAQLAAIVGAVSIGRAGQKNPQSA